MVQARGSEVLAEETLWSVSYAGSKDQLQPGQAEQKLNQEVEERFLLFARQLQCHICNPMSGF